jgi:peptidoglycan-N-acetylglucosamine deacetylase
LLAGTALAPGLWPTWLGGLALNHFVISALGTVPRSSALGRNLVRLPPRALEHGDEIALSFDDGPDPEVTPRVLDLLETYGAKASFFLIGDNAVRFPELVREIVHRGHLIENHTQRHRLDFAFSLYPGLVREIGRAQQLLTELAGRAPAYFRAPAGMHNLFLAGATAKLGLTWVSWTRRGFDTFLCDPIRILSLLAPAPVPGDILLLHDGRGARDHGGRPVVLEVLPRLLERLAERDLRAIALPEPCPEKAASLES